MHEMNFACRNVWTYFTFDMLPSTQDPHPEWLFKPKSGRAETSPYHNLRLKSVLRIRDVYLGSRIRIFPSRILDSNFFHPGSEFFRSRIRIFSIPDPNFAHPGSRIRIFPFRIPDPLQSILTQKIFFKLSEIWSGLFMPDPDLGPLIFTHPGSRGQKGTGSRIRNTIKIKWESYLGLAGWAAGVHDDANVVRGRGTRDGGHLSVHLHKEIS